MKKYYSYEMVVKYFKHITEKFGGIYLKTIYEEED